MSDTKPVEQRIEEIRCVGAVEIAGEEIFDTRWYDEDSVDFGDSQTSLTVGDLRAALDSIPAQIAAAVQAERTACADVADKWGRMAPFEYESQRQAEAIRNLICARGVDK